MTYLQDIKFACLDTETTGLSPQEGGRICEVAVSVSRNGQRLEEYSTLLNPGIPIHPDVVAIHGITNTMVANAPRFAEIAPRLTSIHRTPQSDHKRPGSSACQLPPVIRSKKATS